MNTGVLCFSSHLLSKYMNLVAINLLIGIVYTVWRIFKKMFRCYVIILFCLTLKYHFIGIFTKYTINRSVTSPLRDNMVLLFSKLSIVLKTYQAYVVSVPEPLNTLYFSESKCQTSLIIKIMTVLTHEHRVYLPVRTITTKVENAMV